MSVTQPGEKFQHGTVPAGEFTLDYAEAGPSDASVTIVSFPGSAGLELSVAKDVLAQKYRVIEINPPGWGGRTDLARAMTMAEVGELLAEAANQLVPGGYYLIGTSMGGAGAIHAAAKNPDRVLGVILEGAMAPVQPEDLQGPPPSPSAADAQAAEGDERPAAPAYPLPPVDPHKPWATHDYIRQQMENRFKMFHWVTMDMLPKETLASLTEQATPVLWLLGDEDEILKPSTRKTVAVYLPAADARSLHGTHDLQNTAAEEFIALVEEFIGKTSAAS